MELLESQAQAKTLDLDLEAQAAAERLRTGRWAYRFIKRAFDVLFSAFVLVGFSWLFFIVAVA